MWYDAIGLKLHDNRHFPVKSVIYFSRLKSAQLHELPYKRNCLLTKVFFFNVVIVCKGDSGNAPYLRKEPQNKITCIIPLLRKSHN